MTTQMTELQREPTRAITEDGTYAVPADRLFLLQPFEAGFTIEASELGLSPRWWPAALQLDGVVMRKVGECSRGGEMLWVDYCEDANEADRSIRVFND